MGSSLQQEGCHIPLRATKPTTEPCSIQSSLIIPALSTRITPRFAFGYGLTYTTFSYSNLQTTLFHNVTLSPSPPNTSASTAEGGIASLWDIISAVEVDITNSGTVCASEVAQLYIGIPGGLPKQLRGYDKKSISPNQTAHYQFMLTRRDLSQWDVPSQSWLLQSGCYDVFVGQSVLDIKLTGSISI